MAKKKFARSDIPYKDRLLMKKYSEIADHRNEAAQVALQVACVALNDTEGLGYTRLSRFAKRLHELIQEYYDDPEVGQAHLMQRLKQLGFLIQDGKMLSAVDEDGNPAPIAKYKEVMDGEKV